MVEIKEILARPRRVWDPMIMVSEFSEEVEPTQPSNPTKPKELNDFWAYVKWRRSGDRSFQPWQIKKALGATSINSPFIKGNLNAIKAFRLVENGQSHPPSKHPRLLRCAIEGKKNLNWQIKEWASDVQEFGPKELQELQNSFPWLPLWVWKAVMNQANRNK